jgi:hypothetical protein
MRLRIQAHNNVSKDKFGLADQPRHNKFHTKSHELKSNAARFGVVNEHFFYIWLYMRIITDLIVNLRVIFALEIWFKFPHN